MAEAHNAAALSFSLTHDGLSLNYDQELLHELWAEFGNWMKRRFARFRVGHCAIYWR